jgi:hypothetical protein
MAMGFTLENHEEGIARLTDGQLLLTLIEQEFPSPGIAYFHTPALEDQETVITGPGNLTMFRHPSPLTSAQQPTREQNPLLGFFDGLVVGVDDVKGARQWAEEYGYFVLEEFGEPQPQSDVTDGLMTISFRKGYQTKQLCYTTDIDQVLADDISAGMIEALGKESDAVLVRHDDHGNVELIRVAMPEGTLVTIVPDL